MPPLLYNCTLHLWYLYLDKLYILIELSSYTGYNIKYERFDTTGG